jgi:ComEC/Rec2-related protein
MALGRHDWWIALQLPFLLFFFYLYFKSTRVYWFSWCMTIALFTLGGCLLLPLEKIKEPLQGHYLVRVDEILRNHWIVTAVDGEQQMKLTLPEKTNLQLGDEILVFGTQRSVPSNVDPLRFPMRTYLASRGVFLQLIGKDYLHVNHSWRWAYLGIWAKSKVERIFGILPKRYAAWLDALLIGDTSEVDEIQKNAFRNLGVTHLLAVSGMHLAILYAALIPVFRFVFKNKYPILVAILTLTILWSYTLLCGASVSIVRASLMFSILTVGKLFSSTTPTLNLLALSALLLIVWHPYYYYSMGFWLSHLAVLGIVLYHPMVMGITAGWAKWKKWSVEMVLTTVHAQLTTLPLLLTTFHTFPLYFIPANMVLIPLTSVLLYVGIGWTVLSAIYPVAPVTALLQWGLDRMESLTLFLSHLPHPLLYLGHIGWMEQFLLVVVCYLYFLLLTHQVPSALRHTKYILLCYTLASTVAHFRTEFHLWALVHRQQPVLLVQEGNRAVLYSADSTLAQHPWVLQHGGSHVQWVDFRPKGRFRKDGRVLELNGK